MSSSFLDNTKPCGNTTSHPSHMWVSPDDFKKKICFGAFDGSVVDIRIPLPKLCTFSAPHKPHDLADGHCHGIGDWTPMGSIEGGGEVWMGPEGLTVEDVPLTGFDPQKWSFGLPLEIIEDPVVPPNHIFMIGQKDREAPMPLNEIRECGNYVPHAPHGWPEAGSSRFYCNGRQPSGSTDMVRWADRAMFEAEPISTEGPKVHLLSMTSDPLGAIAAACKMYKGEVVRDLASVTDEERLDYLAQVMKTKLKAPFEFVKLHFLIEGVTRAFTHQLVRQRTAAYAQESLRFAVKTGVPTAYPPSIEGLPKDHPRKVTWDLAVQSMRDAYEGLVDDGVPAEDARGLLPHNVLTRVHYTTDLRALLDHAGNRLCTQAQFEWRLVFAQIVQAIRNASVSDLVMADGMRMIYLSHELAAAFKPVCYQTGKCEFKADFDRACSIRDRVDANAKRGRPSSEWEEPLVKDVSIHPETPRQATLIEGIKPGEWLLDPGAAREK